MKPATTLLIVFLSVGTISAYTTAASGYPEGIEGTKRYSSFQGVDLIVRFDSTFSEFNFSNVQDDFDNLGLALFSLTDSSYNVAAFRPITFHSDSSIIEQVYQIPHVDTVYYPLINGDGYITYYDDRKIVVDFYEGTPDSVCEQIIAEHNCTIIYNISPDPIYYLSIQGDQTVFSLMDTLLTLTEVHNVGYYTLGSGGVFTPDYIQEHYWENFQFTYESGRIYFALSYSVPSEPCYKLGELERSNGHDIDYYGIIYAGSADRVCTMDDTLSFEVTDTANFQLTLHHFLLGIYADYRTIVSREPVYTTNNYFYEPVKDDLLRYIVTGDDLLVWYTGQNKEIKTMVLYSINGMIKISAPGIHVNGQGGYETSISGFSQGIYVGFVVFSDGTTGSFKFLKH
jgi:hypothetical protein